MATFESREFDERESRFIVGVFNYCDRWCEKCRFNDRCRVYDREKGMRERHEILGEDPDDMSVVMQDVGANLAETMEMLQQMAEEMGVDLDAEPESEEEEEEEIEEFENPFEKPKHPLLAHASDWMDKVESLLDMVREEIPDLGKELAHSLFKEDDEEKVEARGNEIMSTLMEVRDSYELLGRYRYFIIVKLTRAVRGIEEAEKRSRRSAEMAEFSRDDARGSAKVVDECIAKSVKALWTIAEFDRNWLDTAMPLANEGELIRRELAETVPDFHLFHRPGFDDEPESAD